MSSKPTGGGGPADPGSDRGARPSRTPSFNPGQAELEDLNQATLPEGMEPIHDSELGSLDPQDSILPTTRRPRFRTFAKKTEPGGGVPARSGGTAPPAPHGMARSGSGPPAAVRPPLADSPSSNSAPAASSPARILPQPPPPPPVPPSAGWTIASPQASGTRESAGLGHAIELWITVAVACGLTLVVLVSGYLLTNPLLQAVLVGGTFSCLVLILLLILRRREQDLVGSIRQAVGQLERLHPPGLARQSGRPLPAAETALPRPEEGQSPPGVGEWNAVLLEQMGQRWSEALDQAIRQIMEEWRRSQIRPLEQRSARGTDETGGGSVTAQELNEPPEWVGSLLAGQQQLLERWEQVAGQTAQQMREAALSQQAQLEAGRSELQELHYLGTKIAADLEAASQRLTRVNQLELPRSIETYLKEIHQASNSAARTLEELSRRPAEHE